ncbi:MAG: MFS transporter [Burkholderiales bacterium]|nr:MFS transporter [Burkholderiales bacterium]
MPHRLYPPLALAFTVWGLGAVLYLIGFFQRVAPAVLTRELSAEFSLTAAALGNLSAVYFYSYVAMQIPTGVLADHYGPRRVLTAGAALAAAGTFLFATAESLPLVLLGRFLIGASVGVAFVSMMKLSTHWFAAERFAMVAGLALAAGVVGAVSAGAPLRWLSDAFGWRGVMLGAGVFTAVLAIAVWLVVRDDPGDRGFRSFITAPRSERPAHSMLGGVVRVLRERNVWLIFVVNGGISGPSLTFAGLWGVPFLVTHYGVSTATAALITSLTLLSWAVAGPLVGHFSDRIGERKPLYVLGAVLATLGWGTVFLVPDLPLAVLVGVLVATGVASAVVMIGFAYAKESAPMSLAGTTGGVINMGNMLGGMLMQPAVGWVLDRFWSGETLNGARIYSFDAYRAGFALLLFWLELAVVLALLTRETHARQRH